MTTRFLSLGLAVIALATALTALILPRGGSDDAAVSTAERAAMEQVVEAYILDNPDIIPRALQRWQYQQQQREQDDLAQKADQVFDQLASDPRAPSAGPENAPVTIVEYFDYRCQYCRVAYKYTSEIMASRDDVRYIFKLFPVLDREDDDPALSRRAAIYAMAAEETGRFAAYHDAMMTRSGRLTPERLDDLAQAAGLAPETLAAARQDAELAAYVDGVMEEARLMGIRATPTFLINGQVVQGAGGPERILDAIERAKNAG
ncbi:protein-disulfide isomerase [Rhodothalassium salexigens DSM 2132]|uniref:Protein-disulfide isomerase n=1 Tax=Rhodothalassium salexigens DSM 2132 TaxID=1188247 RepID=A0A4R2PQ10_RHOSA|nr:thioredoxin domain-containing protein [Rhodothalassium salexigens]MBB4210570.1 protein-disulfide isomerase [Rhodothalassium salexigens DSM 2132]MBK1639984.1 hypothetical protein [Rhodothalassium salexigens DSM 2132]TCP37873.1 protein-disulfide isomerase [Rhodothalassium salexigens DSM 2132]